MAKKKKTDLTPEFWRKDAEVKRQLAERIAYLERRIAERKQASKP